ncbi:DUF5700 domain-containing putative Zn-dependent protease [Fibrella sp. WM1]|uniref:DUF5700 domain-containing putative Zn-dependent protease n=1 Tax=Fibrella musci TaxID=3242485 RepID=UPI003520AAFA
MSRKLLLSLLGVLIQSIVYAQSFNAQPCYEYWKLTDQLRKGIRPDAQDWERLRQFDGYKRKNTTNWQEFVRRVSLVYWPGNEAQISEQLKTDLELRWIVRYAREEANLKKYLTELDQLHLLDSARSRAQAFLPPKFKNCSRLPVVDLILYDYDASGTSNGIVMDLLVSYDTDRYKPGALLGHEYMHYALAYCRIKFRHFREIRVPAHRDPFRAINGISEEGTADLIDKAHLVFDKHSLYMLRDTFLVLYDTKTAASIRNLNDVFEKLADGQSVPIDWPSVMPVNGHIPGLFMGQTIQQQGLQDKLIRRIENPFQFFYLYNKAAIKANAPQFSPKALSFIKLMERNYYR